MLTMLLISKLNIYIIQKYFNTLRKYSILTILLTEVALQYSVYLKSASSHFPLMIDEIIILPLVIKMVDRKTIKF